VRRGKRWRRAGWRGNRGRPRLPWTAAGDSGGQAGGREQAVEVVGGLVGGGRAGGGAGQRPWVGARGMRAARAWVGWAATGGVGRARGAGGTAAVILNREREKDRRKMLPGGGYFE
jgi:hypothetical protein